MKSFLAFLVTVFVGVAAGSCLLVIDTLESETKRRAVVATRR